MNKEIIIISLGGSLVAPENIDTEFLKSFKSCLEKYFKAKQFFVIVGGGKTARNYQKALAEFGAKDTEKDWAGIDATRMNARILKQVFTGKAYPKLIDPTKKIKTKKDIIVSGGYKPGNSSDYVSVLMAKIYGAETIINLSNIDYVYEKNPKDFPDAKPLEKINWGNYIKIIGSKWSPGLSTPFDPRASKMAEKLKIKVVIINGKNLERLEDFLNNKPFIGTTIQ